MSDLKEEKITEEKLQELNIVLDGKKISESEFVKESEKKNVRIVKQEEGTFKSLHRMHG
jgi:hypothetical protein